MSDVTVYTEAERQILSAMMHGGAEKASEHLTPADFFDRRHAVMYDHLLELWGGGEPTDPPALLKRLADRGELTRPETAGYLHELYSLHADPLQIGYYARIVVDGADQRRWVELSIKLARAADISDADARAEQVAKVLGELATTRDQTAAADTWTPIDLGPYLDGTVERPEPSIGLVRSDGLQLLYPGKEHAVIGEMESGKSWFALGCVAAELIAGRHVVYIHFEEDDPSDTVDRLLLLGVPRYQIRTHFGFVGPHAPATPDRIAKLVERRPSLVVLDGQNEGMVLHGQDIREESGAGMFRSLLVKPWTAAGAAVLACDHVVKDAESRGRYALGSIHKGNALNGSLIVLENMDPFGRGERGVSRVYVTKDRPGHLRRHGQKTKIPGKTYLGLLAVDDTRVYSPNLDLQFYPPADAAPEDTAVRTDNPAAAWITKVIAGENEQTVGSKRQLLAAMRAAGYALRDTQVSEALDDLLYAGTLEQVTIGRGQGYRIKPASPEKPESSASQDSLFDSES